MMANDHKFIIGAILLLACLTAAQENGNVLVPVTLQQQVPLTVAPQTCTPLTSKPSPETKKYVFKTCLVAQLAAYISIGQDKYIDFKNGTVNQNYSNCENKTSVPVIEPKLVIDFECGQLSLSISHTNDSRTFVQAINGLYKVTTANVTESVTYSSTTPTFYTTQSGHYYKCNAEQDIPVKVNHSLVLSNFALEAYRDAPGTDFYQIPQECPLDSRPVSDLVRIGVGVCLIALVAIVLIAYFIGRRRWSERSSYESV